MLSIYIHYISVVLLLLLIGPISTEVISPKKRVCVIGAGVSGLISVKYLIARSEKFEVIAFDKNSDVGGLWTYTDSQDLDEHGLPVHSSVYKNLRTNSPKEFMALPDYQQFYGENRSYVGHETVLEYLHNYTEHFNLRPYIQLNTLVTKVRPVKGLKWRVQTLNLNTYQKNKTICDAVIVGNGHFFKPYVPEIPEIQRFPGRVIHSHIYRKPEQFINQTVVILGASYSGIEIGIELSQYANMVYLSHRHDRITAELPKNLVQVPGIIEADDVGLVLSNGSRIIADSLIYCTGYLHDFPFLNQKSGIEVEQGKYIHPLYKHIVNVKYPTIFFVNVPHPSFMFWIGNGQAQYVVAVLEGKAKLPNREEMLRDAQLPVGRSLSKAHYLLEKAAVYYDELAAAGGFAPVPPYFEEGVWKHIKDQAEIPMHYKEKIAVRRENGTWDLVWPCTEKFTFQENNC